MFLRDPAGICPWHGVHIFLLFGHVCQILERWWIAKWPKAFCHFWTILAQSVHWEHSMIYYYLKKNKISDSNPYSCATLTFSMGYNIIVPYMDFVTYYTSLSMKWWITPTLTLPSQRSNKFQKIFGNIALFRGTQGALFSTQRAGGRMLPTDVKSLYFRRLSDVLYVQLQEGHNR